MRDPEVTPLGALGRGLVAGVLGTGVFTLYQKARAGLSGGGGGPGPPESWDEAPAPAKVGKRFVEGVFHRRADLADVPALTRAMHWGYGTAWGALYGLLHESIERHPLLHGAGLGVTVVAADYTLLPAMGLYSPPWEYDAKTLANDLANHLVFGLAVAGGYEAVRRLGRPTSR